MELYEDGVILKFDKDDIIRWLETMGYTNYYQLKDFIKDTMDAISNVPSWGEQHERIFNKNNKIKKNIGAVGEN